MNTKKKNQRYINEQREKSRLFRSIDDGVIVPNMKNGNKESSEIKFFSELTIDDAIFAQQGIKTVMLKFISEMKALDILHDKARDAGGKGADNLITVLRLADEGEDV